MPNRIYPIRPIGRRYAGQQEGGGFESGWKIGSQIGGELGKLGSTLSGAIAQQKQDAIANRLMNTDIATPRAALVDPGVNPATGAANQIAANVPTAGSAPVTGGTEELALRMKTAQLQNQLINNQYNAALKNATIAQKLRGGRAGGGTAGGGGMPGSGSRWKAFLGGGQSGGAGGQYGGQGKAGKPQPYEPGTSDPNDPASDDFGKVRADFDQQYGKGAYDKFQANFPNLNPDPKGNYSILDKDGNPAVTVPGTDVPYWMSRTNAGRIGRGQGYIGTLPEGTNPNSGQKPGTQVNPIAPKSNLELRSLPYGTWLVDPDTGKTMQKQPLKPQGTASADDLSGSDTDLASTGDLSQPDDLLS